MPTRFTSLGVKGTTVLTGAVTLTAGIVGTLIFSDQAPVLSGTGTSSTQIEYIRFKRDALTATGGLQKYELLSQANPLSTTGSIRRMCIEVATAAAPTTTVDCTIENDSSTGSGGTVLFNDETLSAGIHCIVPGSTEVTIGPTERVRCSTTVGTGASLSAESYLEYNETILN